MAEGWSAAAIGAILAAALQQTPFKFDHNWIQLHVGAPGAAGTSNIAAETTRIDAVGAFGGTITPPSTTNDAAVGPWSSVAASEDYTHFTSWSASAGGTFQFSGTITATSVTIGDNFVIPIGDMTVGMTAAS